MIRVEQTDQGWEVWSLDATETGRILGIAKTKKQALRLAFEEQGRDRKELARLMLEENKQVTVGHEDLGDGKGLRRITKYK